MKNYKFTGPIRYYIRKKKKVSNDINNKLVDQIKNFLR